MIPVLCGALVCAMLALPVSFAVAADSPAPATAPAKVDSDSEKVCKTVRPTGSRLGRRTCRTRAEWAAIEGTARSAMDDARDSGQAWQPRGQ